MMKYTFTLLLLFPLCMQAQFDIELEETEGVPPLKARVADRMTEEQGLTDHVYVIDVLIREDANGVPIDTLVLYTDRYGRKLGPIYFAQSGDWSTFQEIPKNEDFDPFYYSITGLTLREDKEKERGVTIVNRDDWYADIIW